MIKINNYLDKIKAFCDFTIEYDRSNKTYLFNNKYIDDIDCLEYEVSINILKSELIDVCIDIKKPQNFIKNVLIEIEKTAVWYEKERIELFENFEKLSPIIVESRKNKIREAKSKYTIEQLRIDTDAVDSNSDDLLFYLILNKSITNNYKLKGDLERVKLHYVVIEYFKSIYSLIEYLLMLDDLEEKFGIEDFNQFRPIPEPHLRCNINLSKIECAHLFNAFFETGYFFFDSKSDLKNKRAKMKFIDSNFNYRNQHGKIATMKNIIKEFSEIEKHAQVDSQSRIIDNLIEELKAIKARSEKLR